MRRGLIITCSILGVLALILTVALASVGTRLDQTEIDRRSLEFDVDQLEQDLTSLTTKQDALNQQAEEQRKTIEQLKADLEKARTTQASSPPSSPPVLEPAPAAP